MHFKNQEDLKHHVERLKAFYNELYTFLITSAFSVLVWLLAGAGYFWPIWILVLWGGPLFLKASKLGIVNPDYHKLVTSFRDQLPFLKKSWEHEKLQELQRTLKEDHKAPVHKAATMPAPKKKAVSKKAAKTPSPNKVETTKAPAKKAMAKKATVKKEPTVSKTNGNAKKEAPKRKAPKKV